MSRLIDEICRSDCKEYIDRDGNWWIAKPLNKAPLKKRINDAIRVLRGKSFACHYKQDETRGK